MNKRTVINHLDPRAGLWLPMANIGMFCQKILSRGVCFSGVLSPGLCRCMDYIRRQVKGIVFTCFFPPFTNVCISAVPRMDEYGVSSFS